MALNSLKIIVVDGGKGGGGGSSNETVEFSSPQSSNKNKKSNLYKILHLNSTIQNKFRQSLPPTTFFAVQSGISTATQLARQTINYYISDIGRRNGDSNYQAVISRKIEQVTDGLSIAGGALSGASAGSVFGPAGVAIGAAFGAISSATSLGFKYAERERTYQHEMFKLDNSQAYNLNRANYSALTGRVR